MTENQKKAYEYGYAAGSEIAHNAQQSVINDKKRHIEELEKTVTALEYRNEELVKALESIAHNCSYGDDGDVDDLLNTIDYTQKEAKEALLNQGTKPNENES